MPFLPIGPCCLEGNTLPGEPAGVLEPATDGNPVARYHAKPNDGNVVDSKTALVLFYDAFGLGIPNPKIIADEFAEKLRINVFVPDYIPNPPPPKSLDAIAESYPGEHAKKSWLRTILDYGSAIVHLVPYVRGLLNGAVMPLASKACEQLKKEGYENLGAIGYCRGGSVIVHLMSKGDASLLKCGVICHPSPEGKDLYGAITFPTQWHLASHDMRFKDPQIAELRQAVEKKSDVITEITVHPDTVHGFAARPNLKNESAKAGFEKANDDAIAFFNKHLLSSA
ncbi:hypothetical protein JCM24511_07769 [Saitozyma sp. JCM 24511]|nr:hypothetical protein JCM24511_07769 [Saitozyma sp. JCM 24511]